VVADPARLGHEIDCAGEDRQQLWAVDPSSSRGGGAHISSGECLVWKRIVNNNIGGSEIS
jgi:hypothetical protein